MSPFSKLRVSPALLSRRRAPQKNALNRRYARWEKRGRAPREGQALILAVFIMLFAALLSSTFLILVASNTQTVGRSIDKSGARSAADEGAQKARALMVSSTDADNWQPESEPSLMGNRDATLTVGELPPAPGDPSYDEYWTPLDKAMGWALTQNYTAPASDLQGRLRDLQTLKGNGGHVFIKFPDPRYSREATRFMLESRVLSNAIDEVTDGGDKKWMLRVASLGFSEANPEVWARQLLYKATNLNGSAFSYANFVSNYDFTKNSFASTSLNNDVSTGTTTLPLKNLSSFGTQTFAPGQSLMLSDGLGDPFTGILASVNRATGLVTLKTGVPRNFGAASTTVSVVATLMSGLNAINDNGARTTLNPANPLQTVLAPVHAEVETNPAATTDNAAYGNGSFYNLGLKIGERAEFKARPPFERTWGTSRTYSGFNALTVTGPLDRSAANLSLYDATAPAVAPQTPPPLSAAQNKYFRLSFTPQGAMQVDKYLPEVDPLVAPRPIKPARINMAHYKANSDNDQGIFLDNAGDFEKIGGGALDNSQLQRLWQRKSFAAAGGGNITYTGTGGAIAAGNTGTRLSFPRPGVDGYVYPMASGSLEQRAIRGWISPWEFLPRGALVELKGNVITVTSDPLKDDGTIDTAKQLTSTGAYSRDYAAPASGILCATGNLRVRGNWTGAPLTIVSGRNLYIEGAIDAEPGKVALLAKDNVTLNPTQFLARPAGLVDRHLAATPADVAAQSGATVALKPGFVGRFKVGDAVAPTNSNQWVRVTAISGDVLTLSGAPGALGGAVKLRQLTDPTLTIVDADGSKNHAYALGQNSDNLYRVAQSDGNPISLGLRRADQRVEATIKAISTKTKYELNIKTDHNSNGKIDPNWATPALPVLSQEMWMWGRINNQNDPAKGAFAYNLNAIDGTQIGDAGATLSRLQAKLATVTADGVPAWALTLPGSSLTPNPYGAVPMRRLAKFYEFYSPAGAQFKVPLTNSVGLFWNNTTPTPTRVYGSFWGRVNVEADQNKPEVIAEIESTIYGRAPIWQALMVLPGGAAQANLSLQRDVVGDPDGLLPQHYIAGWHMEGNVAGSTVTPVYAPKIGATIYAESGSWFVIPMPAQITNPIQADAGRWRRSFYQVSVQGNIAQAVTPTTVEDYDNEEDPDGQAVGATKRWLDALACPRNIGSGGAATNWQTISYQAEPLAPNNGLALPSTAEVLYTYVE